MPPVALVILTGLLDSLERIQKRLGGQRYEELRANMQHALVAHERGNPEIHKAWIRERDRTTPNV